MSIANLKYGLDKVFPKFKEYVEDESGESLNPFQAKAFIDKHEDYKYKIFDRARKTLDADNWVEEMIGSRKILENVKLAIKANDNLVNWRLVANKLADEAIEQHGLLLYERTFYELYTDKVRDEDSFGALVHLFGKNYSLLAYLFFIKNKDAYCPIATQSFDEIFNLLGLQFTTKGQACWDNYNSYCQIIAQTRDYLRGKLNDDLSLLDAHSFLWILNSKQSGDEFAAVGKEIAQRPTAKAEVDYMEGFAKSIITTVYERDSKARRACIEHFGYNCQVCGFNFEDEYGKLGKDFIHVHHIKPISQKDGEYKVDPIKDLLPVCPNCHALIHRTNDVVENLKKLNEQYGC
jgi:hypothetical protein